MQTTPNLPNSCKTSGHCFRKRKDGNLDYKKTVEVRCSRCNAPEKSIAVRKRTA